MTREEMEQKVAQEFGLKVANILQQIFDALVAARLALEEEKKITDFSTRLTASSLMAHVEDLRAQLSAARLALEEAERKLANEREASASIVVMVEKLSEDVERLEKESSAARLALEEEKAAHQETGGRIEELNVAFRHGKRIGAQEMNERTAIFFETVAYTVAYNEAKMNDWDNGAYLRLAADVRSLPLEPEKRGPL